MVRHSQRDKQVVNHMLKSGSCQGGGGAVPALRTGFEPSVHQGCGPQLWSQTAASVTTEPASRTCQLTTGIPSVCTASCVGCSIGMTRSPGTWGFPWDTQLRGGVPWGTQLRSGVPWGTQLPKRGGGSHKCTALLQLDSASAPSSWCTCHTRARHPTQGP